MFIIIFLVLPRFSNYCDYKKTKMRKLSNFSGWFLYISLFYVCKIIIFKHTINLCPHNFDSILIDSHLVEHFILIDWFLMIEHKASRNELQTDCSQKFITYTSDYTLLKNSHHNCTIFIIVHLNIVTFYWLSRTE